MRRLSSIFIITILICLIVSIVSTNVLMIVVGSRVVDASSRDALETQVISVSEMLNNLIRHIEDQVDLMAMSVAGDYSVLKPEAILESNEHMLYNINASNDEIIATYLVFNPDFVPYEVDDSYPYQRLFVKDTYGKIEISNNLANQSDLKSSDAYMAWFRQPIDNGKGVWSDIYEDDFIKSQIITYSAPVIVSNQVVAVIGMDLEFRDFKAIVDSIKVYESGYAFLMNESFDYLVHPSFTARDNLQNIYDGDYAYMVDIFQGSDLDIIEYYFEGKDKIMAFDHLSNGWIVAVAPPIDEVFSAYKALRSQLFMVMFVGVAFSILIAFTIGRRISKPLEQLAAYIEQMPEEDFSVMPGKLSGTQILEIQSLYSNFERMRLKLKKAFSAIKQQNKHLEYKIDERTKELQESNIELHKSLIALKKTQHELMEVQKQEVMNQLIKNIAHSINTPLGNAITTFSFLEKILKEDLGGLRDLHQKPVVNALDIIEACNTRMRTIVDGLHLLTDDFDGHDTSVLNLSTLLESRLLWIKGKQPDVQINWTLEIEKGLEVEGNQKYLTELIDRLVQSSLLKIQEREQKNLEIHVSVSQDGQTIIRYVDHLEMTATWMKMFEEKSFIGGISDHHLIFTVITSIIERGLKGYYDISRNSNGWFEWYISLPGQSAQ